MKRKLKFFGITLFLFINLNAQYEGVEVTHYIKVEAGYLHNYLSTLPEENTSSVRMIKDGINVNMLYGWDFNERTLLGFGAGFLGLDDYKGFSTFTEMNFFISNQTINPFIGFRGGYNLILSENFIQKGSVMGEFLAGVKINFGLCNYSTIFLQSGLYYTHNTLYFPVRVTYYF